MLTYLKINNIALIDELEISFDKGMNVITGETGAGKSIIIDSLNFVVGGKVNKNLIKSGTNFICVEAIFSGNFSQTIKNVLTGYDIDFDDEILIKRRYTLEGKNEIRVNGVNVTASMLKAITAGLVDIHGQHEHQAILQEKHHLSMLDNLIGKDFLGLIEKYSDEHKKLSQMNKEISSLGNSSANRERMLDLLQYQISEIENAKLKDGEEDELINKRTMMLNGEKIANAVKEAYQLLNQDYGQSISDSIKKATSNINSISKFDNTLDSVTDRMESARLEIQDITDFLKDYLDNVNFDQKEFDAIDERLDKIKLLKKKYGSSIEEILKFLDNARKEYDGIVNSAERLEKCLKEKKEQLSAIFKICKEISDKRRDFAKKLEKNVTEQLVDLGMKNSKFVVEFRDIPAIEDIEGMLNATGFDDVKFMFSANIGQPLKPLAEIVSGGEASRFMLALKNIIADADEVNTLVFDEIDTGISGNMGYMVACKLANIGVKHQVISVSHLPQICAMADSRFVAKKFVEDGTTKTSITKLDYNASLKEIARLSGGMEGSNATIEHSKELKERCDEYKKSIK